MKGKKCIEPGCSRPTESKARCPKCHIKHWRKNNPINATYLILKHNAIRRGKVFKLSVKDFAKFCKETGYIDGKGRFADGLSVDRIDVSRGYEYDNLQILTVSENSIKRNLEYSKTGEMQPVLDCPF